MAGSINVDHVTGQ